MGTSVRGRGLRVSIFPLEVRTDAKYPNVAATMVTARIVLRLFFMRFGSFTKGPWVIAKISAKAVVVRLEFHQARLRWRRLGRVRLDEKSSPVPAKFVTPMELSRSEVDVPLGIRKVRIVC